MNKKRIIFSSVCVILLLAMVGGTLAWFYFNEEVAVSYGNSIFCEAGESLEIAIVENGTAVDWASTVDYSAGEFTTVDISGNGHTLFRPSEINEYNQPINMKPAVSSSEDAENCDYIEIELAFRSLAKMNVYLSEDSVIAPSNPDDAEANIYGDFSRDYIAGAMRVAVVDDEGLRMLWAPNSQYELIEYENGTYDFKSGENGDSTAESAYYYYAENETGKIARHEVTAEEYASKKFVVDSTGANKDTTGNSAVLLTLEPKNEGEYAEKTVKIRIWFEGTDREASEALAGGNVNVKLKFVGIAKETDTTKQAAINRISFNQSNSTFSGVSAGMVFSTDGRVWTEYKPSSPNLPVLKSGESIFIKYPETQTHYETDYIKFTKN